MTLKSKQTLIFAIVAAVMLVSTIVLGCLIGSRMAQPSTEDTGIPVYTPPTAPTATLKLAIAADPEEGQDCLQAAINTLLNGFSAEHNIAVEVTYSNVVPAKVKGEYDLILLRSEEVIGYTASEIADLSDLAALGTMDLLSPAMAMGQYGEMQAFVPFTYDRAVIYADRSVFQKLGVALPTGELTGDALDDLLPALSKSVGDTTYVGAYLPYYMPYAWMMYARSQGADLLQDGKLTLTSGTAYAGLTHLFTLLDYGYARSWKYGAYGSDTAICAMALTYAVHPEQDGRYVISDEERAANPAKNTEALLASGDLVMLPIPSFDGHYYGTANSAETWGFSMVQETEKKEAVHALITYALGEEGQKALNAYYGGIPVNRAMWEKDFWRTGLLGCEGSENVLVGIEEDCTDRLDAMLDASKSRFEKNSVRLKTLEWYYFYESIGNADHTVSEYYQKWLAEFEEYANKLS